MSRSLSSSIFNSTVIIAGLGYLVDMYDLLLFAITRVKALKELGLTGDDITGMGVTILNLQLFGLLLGSFLWGALADKFGRKACLYGSVILYSVSMILTSFVQDADHMLWLRFLTGIGLAGEIGAGIALITERMTPEKRGYGVAVFIGLGFTGVIIAGLATQFIDWRTAYLAGGCAGFLLLFARSMLPESDMFLSLKNGSGTYWSSILRLFVTPDKLAAIVKTTLVGLPFALCVGCVTALAPEMARGKGITEPVNMGYVLIIFNSAWLMADLIAARFSDRVKSRRKVMFISIGLYVLLTAIYFLAPVITALQYYIFVGLYGITVGYFALLNVMGAEGTALVHRGVVSTIVPNLARFYVVPTTIIIIGLSHALGFVAAYCIVSVICGILALWTLSASEETYGRDLSV